jgi:hypothetical protein
MLDHYAPTMGGMSGGPILKFNPNTIDILGVVASGYMNRNSACILTE